MAKRSTIKDVAKAAGVSNATVSFVLNKRPGQIISAAVQARVLAAAEALDYHPTAAAAGLARKNTNNVAIVFYRNEYLISNQFYSFVIQGAIKEAIERDYNLLFSFIPGSYSGPADLPKVIRERNAEGALFIQEVSEQLVADVRTRGVPVVAVDNHPYVPGLDSLYMNNVEGASLAAEHLLGLGHTKLAFLSSAPGRPSIDERAQAFRRALEAAGLPFDPRRSLIQAAELNFDAALETMTPRLCRKDRPTAVFCANDEMAAGAIRAAQSVGLRVPDDLSVVGFDDVAMSYYLNPPLTTIGFNKEGMGRRAMARLLELVAAKEKTAKTEEALESIRVVLPVRVVERLSTARPSKELIIGKPPRKERLTDSDLPPSRQT